jgi:hypothetical protein
VRHEAVASSLTFAVSARGLPAGAESKTAESIEGTSNDTSESTSNGIANGKRSPSDNAEAQTTAFCS